MKQSTVSLIGSALFISTIATSAMAGTIYVPEDYATITEAAREAADGDWIYIGRYMSEGEGATYRDESIRVTGKSITIKGWGSGTIRLIGNGTNPVIRVGPAGRLDLQILFSISASAGEPAIQVDRGELHVTGVQSLSSDGTAVECLPGSSAEFLRSTIENSGVGLSISGDALVSFVDSNLFQNRVSVSAYGDSSRSSFFEGGMGGINSIAEIGDSHRMVVHNTTMALGSSGFHVDDDAELILHNNIWYPIEDSDSNAVEARGTSSLTMTNNTISNFKGTEAVFMGNDVTSDIRDNVFYRMINGYAIRCSYSGTAVVSHNAVEDSVGTMAGCPADPDLIEGDLHLINYHPDPETSPLVDSGSDLASSVFPEGGVTTSPDGEDDIDRVDRGYHWNQ